MAPSVRLGVFFRSGSIGSFRAVDHVASGATPKPVCGLVLGLDLGIDVGIGPVPPAVPCQVPHKGRNIGRGEPDSSEFGPLPDMYKLVSDKGTIAIRGNGPRKQDIAAERHPCVPARDERHLDHPNPPRDFG